MTDHPPSIAADGAADPAAPVGGRAGSAILIGKAMNFARLRREIGRARAARLGDAMTVRLASMLAAERMTLVAADTVEVVLHDVDATELVTVGTALAGAFAGPFEIDGAEFVVELLLGGAVAMAPGIDELRLVEEAEAALADAVRTGAPAIRAIDRHAGGLDRAALSRDLVTAMRDNELLLHYQPKVHLRRRKIVSLEALIRWQHPTRGLIYPNDFIPLAEQTGDIAALTLWALRRVIADHARLAAEGHDFTVYVNIAGILLTDEWFVTRACDIVRDGGVSIGFEITETSVIRDAKAAIANLKAFDAIGIPIAIDDYGAGLSSLAYLKQLPARELKIDKLFVTQLTSSHRDPLIVRSTIDLAHALEMEVVAEGVEHQAALALLSVMGCDMAQGYLISRPLGVDALLAFLDEHRAGWADQPVSPPFVAFAKRA